MKTVIVDSAPFQRKILSMLLETEGITSVEEYDSVPGELPDDTMIFMEAGHYSPALKGLIIVTAPEKDDALLAKAVTAGAHAFLAKPFTRERVRTALFDAELMKGHRS